jgi:hypothetical protein
MHPGTWGGGGGGRGGHRGGGEGGTSSQGGFLSAHPGVFCPGGGWVGVSCGLGRGVYVWGVSTPAAVGAGFSAAHLAVDHTRASGVDVCLLFSGGNVYW